MQQPTSYSQVFFQMIIFLHGKFSGHVPFMWPFGMSPAKSTQLSSCCREMPKATGGGGQSFSWTLYHLPSLLLSSLPTQSRPLPQTPNDLSPSLLHACDLSDSFPTSKHINLFVPFSANLIQKFILLWQWFNMWHQTTYQSLSFLWCIFFLLGSLSVWQYPYVKRNHIFSCSHVLKTLSLEPW